MTEVERQELTLLLHGGPRDGEREVVSARTAEDAPERVEQRDSAGAYLRRRDTLHYDWLGDDPGA